MKFILIMIVLQVAPGGGQSIGANVSQLGPFSSDVACEAAAKRVIAMAEDLGVADRKIRWKCERTDL